MSSQIFFTLVVLIHRGSVLRLFSSAGQVLLLMLLQSELVLRDETEETQKQSFPGLLFSCKGFFIKLETWPQRTVA